MSEYKIVHGNAEEKSKLEKIQQLCWKIFIESEDGKELHKLLIDQFIINRPVISHSYEKNYGEHYVGIREGQNDMIRELHNMGLDFKRKEENLKNE